MAQTKVQLIDGLGNVDFDNLNATGIVTATSFVGSGASLTGIVTATGGFNIGIQSGGIEQTTDVVTAINFIGAGNTFNYNAGTKTIDVSIDDDLSGIPQNAQTSAYTLVLSDNGKHISITTGGVTVPASVFSAGDTISIYNNSALDQTITQGSGVTLRYAGTVNTGNLTIAQRGLVTVLCVSSNEFVISGAGLS
jgi:hypothetical protein